MKLTLLLGIESPFAVLFTKVRRLGANFKPLKIAQICPKQIFVEPQGDLVKETSSYLYCEIFAKNIEGTDIGA